MLQYRLRIGKISVGVAAGQLRPSLEIQVVVNKGAGGRGGFPIHSHVHG